MLQKTRSGNLDVVSIGISAFAAGRPEAGPVRGARNDALHIINSFTIGFRPGVARRYAQAFSGIFKEILIAALGLGKF
jgi:hypothetical protein